MPKLLKNTVLLLLCTFSWWTAGAQLDNLRFEHIGAAQGLPNCNIEQILEDHFGFLWFATCEGLFRYDGYEFKAYRHDVNDTTSLSSPGLRCIFEDQQGNIWVGSGIGLDLLDRRTGTFQRFKPNPKDTETKLLNQVWKIFEDSHGNLWVAANKGLLKFDKEEKQFIKTSQKDKPDSDHFIWSFMEDQDGTIWAGTSNGILKLNPHNNIFEHLLPDADPKSKYNRRIKSILKAEQEGVLLLGTSGGLVKWNTAANHVEKSFLPKLLEQTAVNLLLKDRKGNIWISFENKGLGELDREQQKFHHTTYKHGRANGLNSDDVLSILEDRCQNIWIGTDKGVNKLRQNSSGFKLLKNVNAVDNNANQIIRLLPDSRGDIWSKTPEGIYILPKGEAAGKKVEMPFTSSYTAGSWFWEDSEHRVWMSIETKGVYRYSPTSQKIEKLQLGDTLSMAVIYKMQPDPVHKNTAWLGTSAGLCKLDLRTFKRKWYIPTDDIPDASSNKVSIFEQFGNDEIWLYYTYYKSLGRFDKRTGKFEEFRPPPDKEKVLDGAVKDIVISKEGNIWIATHFGLTHFDINNKEFKIYSKSDGLAESELNTVVFDNKNQLWICGHRFLARFDVDQKTFHNYLVSEEVKSFVSKSKYVTDDGRIFLGTINGIYTFHPERITKNQQPPNIVLTDFKVKDESYPLENGFENTRDIILSHDENDLTFEFSGLHFIKPEGNEYRCKLEGFNEKWISLGREHRAVYANLDHGNYVFRATAANSDGIWNEQGLSINLIITPAYWETMWFKALIILVLLSIGYGLYKNRQHQLALQRQKEIAEHSAEYKTRFLADVSHEIRTPMNAIIGLSKLTLDTPLDKKQAKFVGAIQQSSQNLLTIINDLLDHTKLEAGKFTFVKKPFDLEEIISQLEDTLRHKAEEKNLDFEIKIDPDVPAKLLGDAIRLNQILTNLLGNAIKFTKEGRIWLHVKKTNEDAINTTLNFETGDTGIGIPKDKINTIFENFGQAENGMQVEGTGLGLPIARQLVEKQGGLLSIKSEPGKGTSLWFSLKFEKQKADQKVLVTQSPVYNFKPLKILVVEDTYFNQMLVVEILKKQIQGVEIEIAENGRRALEKLADQLFDIILMDVKMPVMDGYEASHLIRKSEELSIKNIPILGVTASATDAQLQKCKAAGMDDYITKPIDADELLSKIFLLTQNPSHD